MHKLQRIASRTRIVDLTVCARMPLSPHIGLSATHAGATSLPATRIRRMQPLRAEAVRSLFIASTQLIR